MSLRQKPSSWVPRDDPNRTRRRDHAQETLATMQNGSYIGNTGMTYWLQPSIERSRRDTVLYSPISSIRNWQTTSRPSEDIEVTTTTMISTIECSTLEGVHLMCTDTLPSPTGRPLRVGVLNFASATQPGGGFLTGAQAQEESIARASTLYASLMTPTAQQFYDDHKDDSRGGYYTHTIIYSPDVVVFRDEEGEEYLDPPVTIGVVTSPAVNAGVVRTQRRNKGSPADERRYELKIEQEIENAMRERMGRILRVFEEREHNVLILGSFGTGVFKNNVETISSLWAELLGPNGRYYGTFDRIVFAILGRETYETFKATFEAQFKQRGSRRA